MRALRNLGAVAAGICAGEIDLATGHYYGGCVLATAFVTAIVVCHLIDRSHLAPVKGGDIR